jgi:hypothetical protein
MPTCPHRRAFVPGGTWFFTVNLLRRRGNDLPVPELDLSRNSARRVQDWPNSNFPHHVAAGSILWVGVAMWMRAQGSMNDMRPITLR